MSDTGDKRTVAEVAKVNDVSYFKGWRWRVRHDKAGIRNCDTEDSENLSSQFAWQSSRMTSWLDQNE